MNFLVYEMSSIQDLRGDERQWVTELSEKLRKQQVQPGSPYIPYFQPLGASYFKRRREKQRLLARRLDVHTSFGLVPVVVFLELFHRSDPRYEDGKVDKLSQRYDPLLRAHNHEIQQWAETVLEQQSRTVTLCLPDMPERLNALLHPIPFDKREAGIFQSQQWNKQFPHVSSSHKSQLHEALLDAVSSPHEAWRKYEHSHRDVTIYYATLPELRGNNMHYYLLGFTLSTWALDIRDSIVQQIKDNWLKIENEVILPLQMELGETKEASDKSSQLFIDCISRFSSCAYPSYLLADAGLWEKLITTDSMLLPLSSEELYALERLFSGERFPAIIEGRAGSGKTTLLSYYVPERLVRLPADIPEPNEGYRLLYLAENPRLLRNAEEIVNRLKSKLKEQYRVDSMWLHEEYKTFHSYAVNQLAMERRARYWDTSRGYLSYFRFRSLLRDSTQGLRVRLSRSVQNPEILWFVIRSYIKGFNLTDDGEERWMTPEQFATEEELGRQDRQVSLETYEEVWEKVWPWYKRLTVPSEDNNFMPPYWDNLDLAWEALHHRWSNAPSYAVLICDEVQDLTRVELASIFQSSEYLKYNRLPNQASRVPIILAGDSYQTINPACFRWARVKADCAKALVQQIPSALPPQIEPFQLLYNYRNRPSIARLCNSLQLLRQKVVGATGELQHIWQFEDQALNQAVRRLQLPEDSALLRDLFRKGVSFLGPEPVPVYGDQSATAFWNALGLPDGPPRLITQSISITSADVDAEVVSRNESATSLNYDCPADVKGLEKPFYALLGFGTAFALLGLNRFWDWNDYYRETHVSESNLLAAEYFLNRLYVAASRAREQLWIVETEEGWNAFWKPFQEWVSQQKSATGTLDSNDSKNSSIEDGAAAFDFVWSFGDVDELVCVFQNEWPRLAKEYEEQAEAVRNPEFAERAAYYYHLIGDALGEIRSRALQRYLENNVSDAVLLVLPIDSERALKWSWETAAWELLVRQEFKSTWQYEVAKLMQVDSSNRGNVWVIRLSEIIKRNHSGIAEDIAQIRQSWKTWSIVMTELLERAAQGQLEKQPTCLVHEIGRKWQNSPHDDDISCRYCKALGQIEYDLGHYQEAVSLWEKVRHTQHQGYYLAKARVTPYPNNLQYLESAQQWKEILHQYDSHPSWPLTYQDSRRVLRACRELRSWRQALKMAIALENQDFVELWRQIVSDPSVTSTDLREYVELAHAYWRESSWQTDTGDSTRSWSLLILDCFLDLRDLGEVESALSPKTPSKISEQQFDRNYGPLVFGLSQECDMRRIAGHIQRVWENRQEWPSRWEVHKRFLEKIGPIGLDYARLAWTASHPEETAAVAYLLCGIVWQTASRREDPELGGWFDQLITRDYFFTDDSKSPVHADSHQLQLRLNGLLEAVDPAFERLVSSAISVVADAPAELFRELRDVVKWRELQDLLDGLAYLLYNAVRESLVNASEPLLIDLSEQLLKIGKFCQQVRFRKMAVKYYEMLDRATERISFSENFHRAVKSGLQQALQAQREFREHRAASQEETLIRPGQKGRSSTLEVRSLAQRPEAILQLLPESDSYQVRFTIDDNRRGHLAAIEPVSVSGPRGYYPVDWEILVPTGERYRLIWLKRENRLRIEAPDKVFVVELTSLSI